MSNVTALLRFAEVSARTGLSRSSIYARIAQDTFPKPVSIGARAVAWDAASIERWIEARVAAGWQRHEPSIAARRARKQQRDARQSA